MKTRLSIALAQLNPKVGDIAGNLDLALRARRQAAEAGADAVVFSELFLCGYPPEDLLLRREFQDAVAAAAGELAAATASAGPAVLMGMCRREGGRLYNSMGVFAGGEMRGARDKVHLPNYGVFDEARLFAPGAMPAAPLAVAGVSVGAPICEDIWRGDVAAGLAEGGAEMLLVANGSPFEVGKGDQRRSHAAARVAECGVPLVYVNQVGGQDELVFDGGSFVLNADGSEAGRLPRWREAVVATRWERTGGVWRCASLSEERAAEESEQESMYRALVLGLRDYVEKNGFSGVLLGLSGGIDSALTAVLAADALGGERVRCLRLPSRYTSRESMEDAAEIAANLGTRLDDLPIEAAVGSASEVLGEVRRGEGEAALRAVTTENLQARMRGLLLMGLSNDTGALLLTTGNKSELSVGYATLYGDMNGGFNPLKDVYKSEVYALCRWRNACGEGAVIPARVLEKAPSAELREGQRDSDSLPEYEVLDGVLRCLVEEEMSVGEVVARGFAPEAIARRVEGMLLAAEYKRRQGAPGVKLTRRHFGRDRRYPITNGFRSFAAGG